jgi:hypothetical protein
VSYFGRRGSGIAILLREPGAQHCSKDIVLITIQRGEPRQDINGNRLCFVETSTGKDGTIYVKVSKRRFDVDTASIVAGEPMDIPDGRWIDLRLKMPALSVSDGILLDG